MSAAGWTWSSVTPGSRSNSARSMARRLPTPLTWTRVVGEHHALLGGQAPEREAGGPFGRRAGQPDRQARTRRPGRGRCRRTRGAAAARPCASSRWLTSKPQRIARSIWARHSRRASSRSAWSQRSSTVRGKPAVAVEERGGVGDGAPPVPVELGVEREVHPDVLAHVGRRGLAGPRARDHQGRARGDPLAQRLVGADVGGVGRGRGRRS